MPRKPKNQTPTVELSPEEIAAQIEADRVQAEQDDRARAELDAELDFIAQPLILNASLGKESAPQRARDARQVKMDEIVKVLHDTWTKAGRPSTWGKMVDAGTVATYFLPPERTADHKKMITRATVLHGVRPKWGKSYPVTPELARRHNLPENFIGREVLSFAILDRRPRAANGEATAAQTDAMIGEPGTEQYQEQ